MGFKVEYVIESDGTYQKTYGEIRAKTDDENGPTSFRLEQSGDVIEISQDQVHDLILALQTLVGKNP